MPTGAPTALLSLLLAMATEPAPTPPAEVLVVDPSYSAAVFRVHFRGRRRAIEGRLASPRGELSGSAATGWRVDVRVDGRSLRVDGPRWIGRTTRSEAFLAVDVHPDIRFSSAPFDERVLRDGGELPGELTLRGLTRPVSLRLLPSDCARPGLDCDIHVQGELSRKKFGMIAYRAFLRDAVEVAFRVRLRPTPSTAP